MRPIPNKMKQEMLQSDEYKYCMRNMVFHDHICQGRITLEHAFIYAGKQINEKWAIIPICAWAHDVDEWQGAGNLDKHKNEFIALSRATSEDLKKYPKCDWQKKINFLNKKYEKEIRA